MFANEDGSYRPLVEPRRRPQVGKSGYPRIQNADSFREFDDCSLNLHLADSTIKKPMGRINDVLIVANRNYVPVDFNVLDIDCNSSCPIILGRTFLRTIGAIIDMKDGNIKFQFPLRKSMEHFPRKKVKLLYESIMRATYGLPTKYGNT